MSVGNTMKEARKKAGLTQRELSTKAGIGLASLQRYESGERSADVETLEKIAISLDKTINELLWDENDFYYLDILKKARTNRVESLAKMMNITYDRCLALLSETETPSIQEREKLKLITGLSFEEFLTPVERDYGTPTDVEVSPLQNTLKDSLNTAFDQLNAQGQEKAIESVELLTKVPEYKK